MANNITLKQFLVQEQRSGQDINDALISLLDNIGSACKKIHEGINHGALFGVLGSAGSENVQGETQKKLDVLSNEIFIDNTQWGGELCGMASEEEEDVYQIPGDYPKGEYLLYFDPLDGSSNIDVNITVGSIFSIVRAPKGVTSPKLEDYLQQGTNQVCAGFCLYGPSTMMVLTTGNGVNAFTLDPGTGEFVLTHEKMTVPADTAEFAINMSNQRYWEAPIKRYVDECIAGDTGSRDKNFNMRWVASMVGEIYRVLTRGGIFMYPIDEKNRKNGGKLRLMYEANPMAFIMEQAGGAATTGYERIMEVTPERIHQRVGVVMGSKNEVERVTSYHNE